MEDSIECEIKDSIKDNFLYNMDISSSDPIPSLLLPIKKNKETIKFNIEYNFYFTKKY